MNRSQPFSEASAAHGRNRARRVEQPGGVRRRRPPPERRVGPRASESRRRRSAAGGRSRPGSRFQAMRQCHGLAVGALSAPSPVRRRQGGMAGSPPAGRVRTAKKKTRRGGFRGGGPSGVRQQAPRRARDSPADPGPRRCPAGRFPRNIVPSLQDGVVAVPPRRPAVLQVRTRRADTRHVCTSSRSRDRRRPCRAQRRPAQRWRSTPPEWLPCQVPGPRGACRVRRNPSRARDRHDAENRVRRQ